MGRKSNGKNKGWWYRAGTKAYYHTADDGRQFRLVKGERTKENDALAEQAWHKLMAAGYPQLQAKAAGDTLGQLAECFLADRKLTLPAKTYETYSDYIGYFVADFGAVKTSDFAPLHLTRWFADKGYSPSTQFFASNLLKSMFIFGLANKLCKDNPLHRVKFGKSQARTWIVDDKTNAAILAEAARLNKPFGVVWQALCNTGARPSEICKVTAANLEFVDDVAIAVIAEWKNSRKTGAIREVVFTGAMVAVVKQLAAKHPAGCIFRTQRNKIFTATHIQKTLRELKDRLQLPKELVAYSARHTFITKCMKAGMDIFAVAQLCGTSVKMIASVYNKSIPRDHRRELAKLA